MDRSAMRVVTRIGGLLALVISVAGIAEEKIYGDWLVDMTNDKSKVYAATLNDSGSLLAESCGTDDGQCIWTLIIDVSCKGSDHYMVLGNTASGSIHLTVQCDGKIDEKSSRFVFLNWKDLEALLKDSNRVGFAFPMANEQFKAVRFSLVGRTDAMALAEAAAARASKQGAEPQGGTRNTTL